MCVLALFFGCNFDKLKKSQNKFIFGENVPKTLMFNKSHPKITFKVFKNTKFAVSYGYRDVKSELIALAFQL